jgi:hypothetical protein
MIRIVFASLVLIKIALVASEIGISEYTNELESDEDVDDIGFLETIDSLDYQSDDGDSSRPVEGQKSLVIVFDTTRSMKKELDQVRQEAQNIVEFAAKQPENPYYNFVFVAFNDPGK